MFGSHLSVAGGLHNALLKAEELGCDTVAIFTKNQQQWIAKPLTHDVIATFREHAARLKFPVIVAHDSYLINLAAKDDTAWEKAKAAFSEEMRRCDQLGVKYLVTHPGAHCGTGECDGVARVIRAYNDIIKEHPGDGVTVCLETTAGQGTCLGYRFEQIAEMLNGMKRPERFGVCIDTAHLLAAGYDITTEDGTRRVLEEFDRVVGLQRVKVLHLNDSKKALGTRVDRHEHIGRGYVGLSAFRVICTDERFKAVPKILETPKEGQDEDGREWDIVNLEVLRKLSRAEEVTVPSLIAEPETTAAKANGKNAKTKMKTPTGKSAKASRPKAAPRKRA